MKRDQILEARQALVSQLPVTGEILRGSLVERIVRHTRGCAASARTDRHPLSGLTIRYPRARVSGVTHDVPRGASPPVQLAPRASLRGAPLARQLSSAEGGARGDLRT